MKIREVFTAQDFTGGILDDLLSVTPSQARGLADLCNRLIADKSEEVFSAKINGVHRPWGRKGWRPTHRGILCWIGELEPEELELIDNQPDSSSKLFPYDLGDERKRRR